MDKATIGFISNIQPSCSILILGIQGVFTIYKGNEFQVRKKGPSNYDSFPLIQLNILTQKKTIFFSILRCYTKGKLCLSYLLHRMLFQVPCFALFAWEAVQTVKTLLQGCLQFLFVGMSIFRGRHCKLLLQYPHLEHHKHHKPNKV